MTSGIIVKDGDQIGRDRPRAHDQEITPTSDFQGRPNPENHAFRAVRLRPGRSSHAASALRSAEAPAAARPAKPSKNRVSPTEIRGPAHPEITNATPMWPR